MTDSLITTKLYNPPPPSNLVPRPHLIEKLNRGLDKKLTIISVPSGYGKSTLLSTWAQQDEPHTPKQNEVDDQPELTDLISLSKAAENSGLSSTTRILSVFNSLAPRHACFES